MLNAARFIPVFLYLEQFNKEVKVVAETATGF